MFKVFFLLFLVLMCNAMLFTQEARILRFPAIHGSQVVFTFGGDLYTVPVEGGVARRLTSDVGFEMFARFSPDGKYIAFSGQYDGNTEVYIIPCQGGVPVRLTYTATLSRDDITDRMGPNNIVMGWRDNNTIVYRSRAKQWDPFKGQLYLVSKEGGMSEALPLPRGGFCSYSPDAQKLAYNQIFREFRTWKRYRGGQADDISIYDFASKKTIKITDHPAQDIIPMWYGNKIYFLSDRDQRMNLFCYDLATQSTEKITKFQDFDVKFPSLGDKNIIMENGGYLYRYDLEKASLHRIPVYIHEDYNSARGGIINVSNLITDFDISPEGKRAVFTARGEIFTVPEKHGNTRNLTNSSGIHERNASWSPDGKFLAYISDASGEDEIYILPQEGGKTIQITQESDSYKYRLMWSPDGKKILWNDRMQRLQFVDITSKKVTVIVKNPTWEIDTFNWSPDSKWIVYEGSEEKKMMTLYLYSLEQNTSYPVTDGWHASHSGVFSDDGQYLFFLSQRNFSPTYSQIEWNYSYENMDKIYLVTLNQDVKSPFAPKSDEVTVKQDKQDKAEEEKKEPEEKQAKIVIEEIQDRIIEVPVEGGYYTSLVTAGNKLYYTREARENTILYTFDLEEAKENELGEIDNFSISHDRKKMIVKIHDKFAIVSLPSEKLDMKETLNLSDMKMNLDRQEEWKQIFHESWRQMRDFFFAPNMHGVDWKKIRENYFTLVPFARHRTDLAYILGEMVGELNAGHSYVGGGDFPKPKRIPLGLLGATLQQDPVSKFYRIEKILLGQNWNPDLRSPLREAGVKAKEGDYILAVNGASTQSMPDIYASFVGMAGKQITLTLNRKPEIEGSWDTVVIPIEDEENLYYYNWVQKNIARVKEATAGKAGYIHIPDMGVHGLNQFVAYFYPQTRKEALIIDVRSNGGGNVSPMIIERLRRELCMIGIARNTTIEYNPSEMHYGPKVCLMDEFSASDGDIFSYRFRFHKLGKLIGKRSWGGVVGIRGSLPFVDGGYLYKPEFSRYDIEGKSWIMEGHGVDPDIVVENDPAQEFSGYDQQLEAGIEQILKELKENQYPLPSTPPYPDKSK